MPFVYIAVAVLAYALDRWSKNWTLELSGGKVGLFLPVKEGIFEFYYAKNEGAAWSMLSGKMWLLIAISSVVVLIGIYFLFFNRKKLPVWPSLCIAMALGGALGNLYDRVVYGYVIDMLNVTFINYPIFNVADSFVCVGVTLLGVWMVFFEEKQMAKMPYRWGAPKAAAENANTETIEENNEHDHKNCDK